MRVVVIALALLLPLRGEAACRLALALALDVSGSVNEGEYVLQLNGLAAALGDETVRGALFAMPDAPVALAVYEWSSSSYQRIVQDWIVIAGPQELDAVRARLLGWSRAPAPEATGLGAALQFATGLFRRAPPCWSQTLDVSGDGKNNDWPIPERLRANGQLGNMTINALVVARDFVSTQDNTPNGVAELSAYFRAKIIHGPNAFIEVALGFEDYAEAMRRKLLRELATRPLGRGVPESGGRWALLPGQ